MKLIHLKEGLRIFANSRRLKKRGYTHHEGDAKSVCKRIIHACYNGEYFQTSTGNFSQFWTRDFGWCAQALVNQGYKEKVHQTLTFALRTFARHGKTTTTISPNGTPYDFPTFAVDTLPWLLRAINISAYDITLHKQFLQRELNRFYKIAIDQKSGLVRQDKHFSSMKDYAKRRSSCYDNAMAASLQRDARELGLTVHFETDYESLLLENFWSGSYFFDDLSRKEYVAGDANVFPFWLDIITDLNLLRSAINAVREAGLDQPLPLKYTTTPTKMIWQEVFVKGYEQDACWMHMGPLYVQLVNRIDPQLATSYAITYYHVVEQYGNVLEVFDKNGKPFSSLFYQADQGMLWAANLLELQPNRKP